MAGYFDEIESQLDFYAEEMYKWATDLFPICRSLTGKGVVQTFDYIKKEIPELVLHHVPSNTQVFDWQVPKEWEINEAYIADLNGNRVIDFTNHNLHVLGYAAPVDQVVSRDELDAHLYSLPNMPDTIPYVTSYYQERWGFCLTQNQRDSLKDTHYRVVIKSKIFDGKLTYGDVVLPGESKKEILFSTYICHPSLANNELSGPVVTMALINMLKKLPRRKYTYRFIFVPETIGSICYLAKHLAHLKQHLQAGFVVTCVGDNRDYSYLASRFGNSLADKVALHTLKNTVESFQQYSYLDRGSDERQYCAPGVDLPVCALMRTKYGEYPEYHTSDDDLTVISPEGLRGGLKSLIYAALLLEKNEPYSITVLCEPQLGKRGLYPTLSDMSADYSDVRTLLNFLTYCDGNHDLIEIADIIEVSAFSLFKTIERLLDEKLIEKKPKGVV